jgi:hypothetical protein
MVAASLLFGGWKPTPSCFSAACSETMHHSFFGWGFAIGSIRTSFRAVATCSETLYLMGRNHDIE